MRKGYEMAIPGKERIALDYARQDRARDVLGWTRSEQIVRDENDEVQVQSVSCQLRSGVPSVSMASRRDTNVTEVIASCNCTRLL